MSSTAVNESKCVLITGGTGMIGRNLSDMLSRKGYKVIWLARNPSPSNPYPTYRWDISKKEIDIEAITMADYIVHLSGDNISNDKWSDDKRRRIYESRVDSAKLLYDTVKAENKSLTAFISSSAIGYYGRSTSDIIWTEDTPNDGEDFFGSVCRDWEEVAREFSKNLNTRSVMIRTGVVLSRNSAALEKMSLPLRYGVATPIGTGRQWLSWIHIDDLCRIYIKAIEDSKMSGPYNAVAPQYINNADFMKALARAIHKPFLSIPFPAFILKMKYGEKSSMMLEGTRISSKHLVDAGFSFDFENLGEALSDIVR